MKKRNLDIIIPLLMCVLICIFYRSANTNSNIVLEYLFGGTYLSLKSEIQNLIPLSNFIIHTIPAALWIFGATLLANGLSIRIGDFDFPLIHAPILYTICLELLQLWHITDGRFDVIDLILPIIAWMTSLILLQFREEQLNISWAHYILFFTVFSSVYFADTNFSF